MKVSAPEKLCERHITAAFDCGNGDLNRFLKKHAYINQLSCNSTTYVACTENTVAAYYTITLASVAHQDASANVKAGQLRYPIPVILLARLAVGSAWQGNGLGKGLLKDACMRVLMVADIAGCRALLIHTKDEQARKWYMQFGMEPSPTDPLHLLLPIKDLRGL
ncbi:MAG: GNAT family N-acetyltransferase [Mariprofundus sp.]|nr:GNAT family N-acetyltransferase [Mariprofundus sp.]